MVKHEFCGPQRRARRSLVGGVTPHPCSHGRLMTPEGSDGREVTQLPTSACPPTPSRRPPSSPRAWTPEGPSQVSSCLGSQACGQGTHLPLPVHSLMKTYPSFSVKHLVSLEDLSMSLLQRSYVQQSVLSPPATCPALGTVAGCHQG